VIVFIILAGVIYGLGLTHEFLDGLKSIALIMASVYNMLVLVSLMGYGLSNMPIYLWKREDNKESLYAELEIADQVRQEYRSSMTDFYMIVS